MWEVLYLNWLLEYEISRRTIAVPSFSNGHRYLHFLIVLLESRLHNVNLASINYFKYQLLLHSAECGTSYCMDGLRLSYYGNSNTGKDRSSSSESWETISTYNIYIPKRKVPQLKLDVRRELEGSNHPRKGKGFPPKVYLCFFWHLYHNVRKIE